MYILHIETSTRICSVALSRDEEMISCLDRDDGMNHTAVLAPLINLILKNAGLRPSDIGAVSVSSGPGSYTGLRVGSSTAKAMAYSLNIPLVSIPSLFALAKAGFRKYPEADLGLPMMDARRNEVYTSMFNPDMKELLLTTSLILEPGALSFIPNDQVVICGGDGAHKLNDLGLKTSNMIVDPEILNSARHLIGPAYLLLSRQAFSDPLHFVPHYLKPPNITQQRKGQ